VAREIRGTVNTRLATVKNKERNPEQTKESVNKDGSSTMKSYTTKKIQWMIR